tara:strand:+ start:14314 stop:15774 length:1461 start_codon:yes stop_codon:yes gene_type:complete
MNKKYISVAILLALLSQLFVACEKDYLDVNKDPNFPTEVPGYVIFPAAVMSTTGTLATRVGVTTGLWSQHLTQSNVANQFKEIDQFNLNFADYDGAWREFYSGALNDYLTIKKFAEADEDWSMYLMATVMEAYTYQYMVDLWDNVPYSEAGVEFHPVFDKGEDIYNGLLASIDLALSKEVSDFPANLAKYDMVFGGNIMLWKQFANTLKLKMYIRMYDAKELVAKPAIETLLTANNLLTSDAGIVSFEDADDQRNPLMEYNFYGLNTGNNLVASKTLLRYLQVNSDPRVSEFFATNDADLYAGLAQGNYTNTVVKNGELSLMKYVPTKPFFFISEAECYFLQAEAILRAGGNAKEMYDLGVVTALNQYEIATSNDFVAVGGAYEFPSAGSFDEKLEAIIQQKWVALYQGTNSTEAYIEHVRTGYPTESVLPFGDENGYVYGQFTYPVNGVSSGVYPKRLPSSKDENQNNQNADELVDAFQPVWWNK